MRTLVVVYGLSLAAVAVAVAIRWLLDPLLGDTMPLSTLFAAVAFAVWIGGWQPAVLVAVVGFILCDYLFLEPRRDFALHDAQSIARTLAYLGAAAVIIGFGEAMRRAQQRSAKAAEAARKDEALLLRSQAVKMATLEAALDCIISIDRAGRIIEFNPAAERAFGYRRGEVVGRELAEVMIPPSLRAAHRLGLAHLRATGEGPILNQQIEMTAMRADGSEFPMEMTVTRIQTDDEPMFTAHLRDITKRKRTEQRLKTQDTVTRALAESGTLNEAATIILRAICEHLGWHVGALWYVDRHSNVLRCAEVYHPPAVQVPQFEAITRQRPFTIGIGLPGRVWASGKAAWIPDAVKDDNFPRAPIADAEGLHGAFGFPIVLNDEVLGAIEFFSHEIRQPDEDLLQMMTAIGAQIGQFIERKRAEEALRESEQRFRILADSAPALIWVNGPQGCEFVNRGYLEFLGVTFADVRGYDWAQFIHPDDRDTYLESYLRALNQREPFELEFRFRRHDGEYRWMQSVGHPRTGSKGEFLGYAGLTTDVTERKQVEQQLKDADRRKDEFLATLAHELRNPLAPIQNALEIMNQAGGDGAVLDSACQMMERQMRHMVRLVDDLLDVSRIARDRLELRRERVELASVIYQAVEACRPLVDSYQHELIVSLPHEPIYLHADPARLAQIFGNLINNGCKYTEPRGTLRVMADREGGDVVVTVKDTGVGIAQEMLPNVFDMFTQIDRSMERSQGGLGIGLSLVQRLVTMHGGSVTAQSEGPGQGSTFVVRLPAMVKMPEIDTTEPTAAAAALTGRSILVVDDNRDAAISLALLLRYNGNTTYTAYDGHAAFEAAEKLRPDVILLDIGLPKQNGYEVCRAIRRQPWGEKMIILALTGWGQEDDRRKSSETGFNAHLVKPVEFAALSNLLAEWQLEPV